MSYACPCCRIEAPLSVRLCRLSSQDRKVLKREPFGIDVCKFCIHLIPCQDRLSNAIDAMTPGYAYVFMYVEDGQVVFLTLETIKRLFSRLLPIYERVSAEQPQP